MKFLKRNKTDNLMLIDIKYVKPNKLNDYVDCLYVIYRDLDTNEKIVEAIENPPVEIYFAKEEYRTFSTNKDWMDKDKCYPVITPYKDIEYTIAKEAGEMYVREYKALRQQRRFYELKNFHKYPYVFGSDLNIEDYYRIQWQIEYGNENPKKITKAFLDIETDAYKLPVGYGKSGEVPINAVTIVDANSQGSYTLLLRNDENPLIAEFEKDIEGFIEELHEDFDDFYGRLEYKIYMYDNEIELIRDIFRLLNTLNPDFCMIWNMPFDIPFIIDRINTLNYDPVEIISSSDFPIKQVYFKLDRQNFKVANKCDYFHCAYGTTFLDQMVLYAAQRKVGSELRGNSLDYTARRELGDTKLDYSSEADMKTFAWRNYRKFVKYNIKDVLLQYGIEGKSGDIDKIYNRSIRNFTTIEKVFKQTIFINNRAYYEYLLMGKIKGNNANLDYGNEDDKKLEIEDDENTIDDGKDKKYSGALVADPLNILNVGTVVMGMKSSMVHDNVIDEDFSSLYPSICMAFNICKNSMIGKIIVLFIPESKQKAEKYDTGQDFIDNMLCDNPLYLGNKWFGLPSIDELIELVEEM